MYNILHITPHLGGGVGSVVLNWMKKDFFEHEHIILSLDKNNNQDWAEVSECCDNVTIYDGCWFSDNFNKMLSDYIIKADIVVVHWWNHPLLFDVMVNYKFPKCRLVMWNHVSGFYAPYIIGEKNIDFSDYFMFTSPVSYNTDEIKKLPPEKQSKLDVIWSTIGNESFKNIERIPHEGFIVGYTGTVDFGKLSPDFIELCNGVKNPNIKFVVCSGDSQQHLIEEAKTKDILHKFSFEGRVPSVVTYLAKYDVFGYPLQPQHFATCEQSIGEAMMTGAVPVVMNNPTESYIVKHMERGIIANSKEEYAGAIEFLYNNPNELKRMSENAKKWATTQYDINTTLEKWHNLFNNMLKEDKKERVWNSEKNHLEPYELYIEALGEKATPFVEYLNALSDMEKNSAERSITELFNSNRMFYSKGKGSILQYLEFFPKNKVLLEWAKLLK